MGRRSTYPPEQLRAMIVDAARRIIETDGLSGLSAREVARLVGYSPGTLYNMFTNLDELILHVEVGVLDDLEAALGELRSSGTRADLHALAQAYLNFTQANPRLWNLLFEHHLPPGMAAPDWYQERIDRLHGRVEAIMAIVAPDMPADRRRRAARVLWASLHGISSLATTDKLANVTCHSAPALVDDLIETYLAGLEQVRP